MVSLANDIQAGAWSLVFSRAQSSRSTIARTRIFAARALSRKWSMRMPAFRGKGSGRRLSSLARGGADKRPGTKKKNKASSTQRSGLCSLILSPQPFRLVSVVLRIQGSWLSMRPGRLMTVGERYSCRGCDAPTLAETRLQSIPATAGWSLMLPVSVVRP